MSQYLSMRKYAEHRGVSVEAVSKAVKTGRIPTVDVGNGRRAIDPTVADREWNLARDPSKVRETVQSVQKTPPAPAAQAGAVAGAHVTVNVHPTDEFGSDEAENTSGSRYAHARAEKEEYAAELQRLAVEEKLGRLVSAEEIKLRWVSCVTTVKTKILAIPSKYRSQIQGLDTEAYEALERIVRSALEDLSEGE